jgi:AmmeMemoRadiSam system protein B
MTLQTTSDVRPAAVAGMFYPADPRRLADEVHSLLSAASTHPPATPPVALIAPHAGYMYSGITAAGAYSLLRGALFDAVVVVSPSHREYFEGISIYPGLSYMTPMGGMNVDGELRSALAGDDPVISVRPEGHGGEHAVEVHLPFLLSVLGPVPFLPVVMGDQSREYSVHLAKRLSEVSRGRNVLLVASTDLSHYHPYARANDIDTRFVELVSRFDPLGIMDGLENRSLEACGGGPVVAVMLAASLMGAVTATILDHRNSGDTTGDRSSVVGYLSAAMFRGHRDEA